jgi:3-deoxy-D-manno-octulosonic-acid transferase
MQPAVKPTGLYRGYSVLSTVILPLVARNRMAKLRDADVVPARTREILGRASAPRSAGKLIWFHAASVGESLSVLSLIAAMGRALPDAQFLITSGTATSAQLIAARMPPRCQHQFAPLDAKGPIRRFLKHWQPDAAILVESELWPNTIVACRKAGIPMALINARLSEKSQEGWAKQPKTARFLMHDFALVLTQTKAMAQALIELGTPQDRTMKGIDLKSLSAPLPVDNAALAEITNSLQDRPVWAACSTHEGEEAEVLMAHAHLLKTHPDLCLILAPRHPDRADAVADLVAQHDLSVTRRSAGEGPVAQVYLADTLGELGLWYAIAPFVFLGGSLRPIGGHNPYEPAHAGTPVLSGPHVTNFAETFSALEAAGGATLIADANDLAVRANEWLVQPTTLEKASKAAAKFAKGQTGTLNEVAAQLVQALKIGL